MVSDILSSMPSLRLISIMGGIELAIFCVCIPTIAAVIAYAAFKGRPRNFSREMYWTAFISAGGIGLALILIAQRLYLSGFWQTLAHYVFGILGLLLFGVAAGCFSGIFIYKGPLFSKLSRNDE